MEFIDRHGTDRRRQYSGELESENLISWLNETTNNPGRRRVCQILDTYFEFRSDLAQLPRAAVARGRKRMPAVGRLEKLLYRYKYYPMLLPFPGGITVHWCPARGVRRGTIFGWAIDYDDEYAVFDLAQLAEAHLLERIKKCQCGKWMFARFSHQRFCSVKCREKAFRSSPEWREYRRKKAREYYRLHKSGKVK